MQLENACPLPYYSLSLFLSLSLSLFFVVAVVLRHFIPLFDKLLLTRDNVFAKLGWLAFSPSSAAQPRFKQMSFPRIHEEEEEEKEEEGGGERFFGKGTAAF